MAEPSALFDLGSMVLDCICETMTGYADQDEAYPGCPCRSYVSPGPPAFDNCCEQCGGSESHGQLTVQLANVFPTVAFPTPDPTAHPCAPQLLVAQLSIVGTRCVPTIEETGRSPEVAAIEAASVVLYTDLWATIIALQCCVTTNPPPAKRKRRVFIERAGTNVTEGGCASFEVSALVEAGVLCPCPSEGS